ncbi:hypothetical protein [Rhizobium sp. Root1212]|uniref:hypothetical protein n=1 Tax=Rhizobium sp. Root1212 TaxID=1736429 RepID=UPI0012E3F400|nr:hypothetical protein [Rhizobium sp. Root1212]
METQQPAATPLKDVIAFAKKHRIEIEDAQKILDQNRREIMISGGTDDRSSLGTSSER